MRTAAEVDQAYTIAAQFNGSQCRECRGNQTVGVIYLGVVSASCENCGAYTPKGKIDPETLRAATELTQTIARKGSIVRVSTS